MLERNDLEEAVALNLFMEFGSIISDEKRSRRTDFTSIQEFQQLDDEMGRSRQFLSFGISTLAFPAPRIHDMMAHELASFTLKGWLFEEKKESPDLDRDIREIKERLEDNTLITELLTIDEKNIIQRVNSKISDQESKVRSLIEAPTIDANLIISTINSNITTSIEDVNFSMDPKLCGEHAREISGKAYDKQRELSRIIIEKVNYLVENDFRGPREAKAYLSAIYRLLDSKIKTFEENYNTFQKASSRAQEPVYSGIQKLRENIGKDKFAMTYHNKKIHSEFLASYMTLSLKREAFRAAHEIIKIDRLDNGIPVPSILSLVDALIRELEEYTQTLKFLSDKLDTKRQEIEATIIGTPIAEGIKLTTTRLKEIAKSVVPNPLSLVASLLNYIKDSLSERDKDGNVIKQAHILELISKRKDDVESLLIQKCSEICVGIRKISVASELRDKPNLSDILSHKIRLSKPMIQAAGFKGGEDIRLNWLATAEPKGDLKVICDAINNIYQYKGNDGRDRHLENLPDPYQIIFASEKGIFPLRRITILEDYRKDYRLLKPKHTDMRISYPDILPTTEEDKIRERGEQAVFFGKMFEFLTEKEDPVSGYKYIYLSYFDDSNRAMVHNKISDNWKALEEKLIKEQIEKEIDKKRTGITSFDKLEELIDKRASLMKTKKEREELWLKLQNHLEITAKNLEGGDMNPEYQRQLSIIQHFRTKYHLDPPGQYKQALKVQTETVSEESPKGSIESSMSQKKFEESYRNSLISHLKKRINDKDKLLNLGIKFYGLKREKASQIFDEEISRSVELNLEQRLEEYRKTFDLAIMDGEITQEERNHLKMKQQELCLTDEKVKNIEKQFTESFYLEIFQIALADNIIEKLERERLQNLQILLNLSDEQIKGIESNFSFEEE